MCDFEKALHNAVEFTFKAKVVGCYFHYCKVCCNTKIFQIKTIGKFLFFLYYRLFGHKRAKREPLLRKTKKKNPEQHKILRMFMALALVPENHIPELFEELVALCESKYPGYFTRFIRYMRSEWITRTDKICVFGMNSRTNNYIESYHKRLTSIFKKRPSPTKFFGNCNRIFYS